MAVTYQPEVIEQFAERLYAEARMIIVKYALVWGIVAAIAALALVTSNKDLKGATGTFAIAGFAAGALGGGVIGYGKSFLLRLQAQQALCQLQTEKNTRAN